MVQTSIDKTSCKGKQNLTKFVFANADFDI